MYIHFHMLNSQQSKQKHTPKEQNHYSSDHLRSDHVSSKSTFNFHHISVSTS